MNRIQSIVTRAIFVGGFCALAGATTSCEGDVMVTGPGPAYIATTTPEYYEGRQVYYYNNNWYYRDGNRWNYYRSEPAGLRERRTQVVQRQRYQYRR